MDKKSEEILEKKKYIPIRLRAEQLHKHHLFESLLEENKKKRQKILEEEKDYEIVLQYSNKKPFNEEDWEKFYTKSGILE